MVSGHIIMYTFAVWEAEMFSLLLFCSEFSKPLLPVGRAGILFSEILHLLCKQMVSMILKTQ